MYYLAQSLRLHNKKYDQNKSKTLLEKYEELIVLRGEKMTNVDRIFMGVFPTGISYADRKREKHGDYAKLAHLFFDTLELRIEKDCPAALAELIKADAAKIQARKGEEYQVSTAGQTITLGYKLK